MLLHNFVSALCMKNVRRIFPAHFFVWYHPDLHRAGFFSTSL
jgi:hypothetical protein